MKTYAYLTVFACAILFASCPETSNTPCIECTASDPAGMADDFVQEYCDDDPAQLDAFEAQFNTDHPGYTINCEGS